MALRNNNFITLQEAADWLNIKSTQLIVPEPQASAWLEIADLRYEARDSGNQGNDLSIEYTSGATAGSEVVSLSGYKIGVQIEAGVTTAEQIKNAIEAHAVNTLVIMSYVATGDPQNFQNAHAEENLHDGHTYIPAEDDIETRVRLLERFINSACTKIENMINGPVVLQEFTETLDMSNTDVLIPSHYPIRSISSLKFNGEVIDLSSVKIRGASQVGYPNDVSLQVKGTDLVLVNGDDSIGTYTLSGIQVVELTYSAGLGTIEEVPEDLKQACLMAVDYYYKAREAGMIGLMSKTIKGDSAYKFTNGLPGEIAEIVEPYVDYSFGVSGLIQSNLS